MFEWACMTHLDTSNTSYGQKKGWESNCQFRVLVENRPDFLMCRWRATYRWKVLGEGYNSASNLISIRGLHAKLWTPKVAKVLVMRISGLLVGSFRIKWHLGASPMARHKVYYNGEGGGSPQVRVVMSLVSSNLPMVCPSTKNVLAM